MQSHRNADYQEYQYCFWSTCSPSNPRPFLV